MRLDDADLIRDELAARRRDRDREREPRRFASTPRTPPAYQRGPVLAGLADKLQASQIELDTASIPIECPVCLGPVFAIANGHGDRVDCAECDARLVTHRAIGGELTALLLETGGDS